MAAGAVVASAIEQYAGESSKAHTNGKTPDSSRLVTIYRFITVVVAVNRLIERSKSEQPS